MISVASYIVNKYQTGFMHSRYIADNGMLVRLIMGHAQHTGNSAIGLLLDQEKAYDRVYLEYLSIVLDHFGFPSTLIHCIIGLFFGSKITINMNRHLSPRIHQQRGVWQGDPLSSLLFNLAFEPLLQYILLDDEIQGYCLPQIIPYKPGPAPAKILVYMDDSLAFL